MANASGWSPPPCPYYNLNTSGLSGWFWVWDSATAQCTNSSTTNTYTVGLPSPNIDGQSRIFYVDWQSQVQGGNPGERYSISFGNSLSATHFVYDTYIYVADPQNVENVQMDTNQVWDQNGDVLILALQCAAAANSWEYTTNVNGQPHWNVPASGSTQLACNPQTWAANTWHHVQLAEHRDSNGGAYYDSITFDGTTTNLTGWFGNSSYAKAWSPIGDLLLNFQLDGIYNNGNEATITAYQDGMTMIWW